MKNTQNGTPLEYDYLNQATWKIVQSQQFLKTKDSQVFLQTDQKHS